ncbi:ABC transporter permease subunit, partial [Bacteroides thetaiotaomicron]|uniref:ABC transporter permease subunit n=2 Tax=Bacteria TaxID=2 RepID=UPI001929A12A
YKYAATLGATRWHLLRYHLLPATVPAIIRHAVGRVAHNAIALASLGYLGVGSTVGSPEWGVILNESVRYLERAGWMAAGPTVLLICL